MLDIISHALSVNTIAIHFPGYPMSYVEAVGTVFYLVSVWLIGKRNMLTWPTGLISVILFFFLFYQIRLYSDALEQVYYLWACIYGWWYWEKEKRHDTDDMIHVTVGSPASIRAWAFGTLAVSLALSQFMAKAHILIPALFPEAASYPFADALTTVMSFTAMFLMARKHTESWIYWIIVDLIGIVLYYLKNVKFLSLLYLILLAMAVKGLYGWTSTAQKEDDAFPEISGTQSHQNDV